MRRSSGEVTSAQNSPEFYNEKGSQDVEGNFAPGVGEPRRGSRIDKPKVGNSLANINGDGISQEGVSVGKQMELEEGNAIKYRTCSWPKVRCLSDGIRDAL